jgi:8-oxo-dGTP diphosphatase
MKKMFVCGFLFSSDKKQVALIEKQRPDWQKGYLNGIGGHIEKDEVPMDAMIREFREETGLKFIEWELICSELYDDAIVYYYKGFLSPDYELKYLISKTTDEQPIIVSTENLDNIKIIDNLRWLIPMALTERFSCSIVRKRSGWNISDLKDVFDLK